VAVRSGQAFVIPALRQHPTNHGHALVLPVQHTRNLADASPGVRDELFAIAATLTAAMPSLYGADGSIVSRTTRRPTTRCSTCTCTSCRAFQATAS
jgi:diadenosine tetraphosphate (Ap4A) HIT family hydrolase